MCTHSDRRLGFVKIDQTFCLEAADMAEWSPLKIRDADGNSQHLQTMAATEIILRIPGRSSARGIRLYEGTVVVGRDPTCGIVLSDPSVSRFHAEFSVDGPMLTVRDLNSRNGTFIDGERIQKSPVRAGQQIQLGRIPFQVRIAGLNGDEGDAADLETESVSNVLEPCPHQFENLPLSTAERRVFGLLLLGHAEKEIAARLEISQHTVHCHVRKIYREMKVRSRAELLARFVRLPNGSQIRTEPPSPEDASLAKSSGPISKAKRIG